MTRLDRELRDLFEADARSVDLVGIRRRTSGQRWLIPLLAAGAATIVALVAGTQLAELRQRDHQSAQPAQPVQVSERPTCAATSLQGYILATFEVGEGVAKICRPQLSNDAGRTWADLRIDWLSGRGPADESALSIGAEPRSGALFLGTTYGRIFRATTPTGEWEVVHDPGEEAFQLGVNGFSFGERLFAASGGLLMSADGLTWRDVTEQLGGFGTLGRGRLVPVGPALSSRAVLLGVSGNRPEFGVWETADEGRTWTQLFREGQPIALSAVGDVVAAAVLRDVDGPAAWISRDAGRTWSAADYMTDAGRFGSVLRTIAVTTTGVFAGSAAGLLELSNGTQWIVRFDGAKSVSGISETPDGLLVSSGSGLWLVPVAQ